MKLPVIELERIKHDLSKEQFSKILGVSRRTIQNWQSGKTEMPISKLIILANTWNCTTDYLLGLVNNKSA
ncbi:MAG: helix-turn-helix domain-containing protein [Acutalibacteraceae bacterium]